MSLMKAYFDSDLARLEREGVQRPHARPPRRAWRPTSWRSIERGRDAARPHNDRFHLQVAFNYGGRADIADAARAFAQAVREGKA